MVFENRVLRRNIWTEEGRSDGRVGKLYIEDLRDLYSSPCIFRMIK
jgi:hypothetical protein